MTLKDYLTQTNIGVNEFARRSRVDRATISRIINGIQPGLRLETAEAIVQASDGEVTFADLIRPGAL